MANQPQPPKPAPRPTPPAHQNPNPTPPNPTNPNPKRADQDHDLDDERNDPENETLDRIRGRDRTGQIPGTPTTPPEGHEHREPAPGEPGGPSGGGSLAPGEPVHTIADEQRQRSAEMQDKGVERVKAEHDERSEEDRRSKPVPGVAHRPVEQHETSRR